MQKYVEQKQQQPRTKRSHAIKFSGDGTKCSAKNNIQFENYKRVTRKDAGTEKVTLRNWEWT